MSKQKIEKRIKEFVQFMRGTTQTEYIGFLGGQYEQYVILDVQQDIAENYDTWALTCWKEDLKDVTKLRKNIMKYVRVGATHYIVAKAHHFYTENQDYLSLCPQWFESLV